MIESVYNNFGFAGSLVLSLLMFFFLIFWMAGVAGICEEHQGKRTTILHLFFAVLVPIYPVVWLISEIISQKRKLNRL